MQDRRQPVHGHFQFKGCVLNFPMCRGWGGVRERQPPRKEGRKWPARGERVSGRRGRRYEMQGREGSKEGNSMALWV